ncbi:hypothetical protein [Nocardia sp. X0981]
MPPEHPSPYWDRIVGDHWPQIPPAAWHGLAAAAREGAEALDLADVQQARHAFDEAVQRSEGLAQIRRALVALEKYPHAFAAALSAAADTFGTFGEVVRRTRNQILDVVDDATDRIAQATRENDDDEDAEEDPEAEAEADRQATEAILTEARGEVADIVAAALNSLGPQGLPRLDDIAEALGQPGPWRSDAIPGAGPRRHGVPGESPGPAASWKPGRDLEFGPWGTRLRDLVPPDALFGRILIDLLDDLLHRDLPAPAPVPLPLSPEGAEIPVDAGGPVGAQPPPPVGQDVSGGDTGYGVGGAPVPGQRPVVSSPEPQAGSEEAAPVDEPVAADEPREEPGADSSSGPDPSAEPDRSAGPAEPEGIAEPAGSPRGAAEQHTDAPGTGIPVAAAPATAPPGAVPPVVFPAAAPPAPGGTAPVTATPAANSAPASASAAGASTGSSAISAAQAGRAAAAPVEAHRAAGATGKIAVPISGPGATAAPGVKGPGYLPGSEPGTEKPGGTGELVQEAVGAAMVASAAPAFVVGERVDGDLALARTLLGGIRAATDSWVVGVDWAVGVLRHPSGVSAFVTSNEGRGWLPARLYLPGEVSLPWLWAVAGESGWEGVADPARILVEFALAWGTKSGSKLSALASSQPIEPGLGRQLTTVALAGSVGPSDVMDLRTPAPGTMDRLGLTAAPRLLDRAAKVPDNVVAVRCLELAVDAHIRVERADLPTVDAMGAPEIRLRILRALRDGRDFAASWWEEIQDADDLIAATVLGHRADTSRVALGDLRPSAADLEPESELSVLRALTFQRRCNELVLLLAEERTRQTLRDAMYAHAQILAHPLFTRPAAAEPAPRHTTVSVGPAR